MVLCTVPFTVTARNIARVLGLPDYPFLSVQHPIGSCTLPELKARAEVAYKQALPILLEGLILPNEVGEVSASYADGGVKSQPVGASDPSVAV